MSLWLTLAARAAVDPRGDAPDARLRSPEEERAAFHLPPGFAIDLVAAEPAIQKPMNVAFDAAGRVWVTGSTLYPWPARRDARGEEIAAFQKNWDDNALAFRASSTPPEPPEHGRDSVRVLSDFEPGTGRARRVQVFADGLNIPIGVLPLPRAPGAKGDSVIVFSIPAIWRLTDTDGDGRADVREKLYDGFGFRDTHGMSSSYWQWFDGWIYGTHGFANRSEVRDRSGRVVVIESGHTYRFRPDGSAFEVVTYGQTNPFGLAFDARGDLYTADSHSKPVYLLLPGGYYEGISKEHDGLGFAPAITTDNHGSSAIAGIAHYSARQFPAEFADNLFNGNPVTRRINRVRLDWTGATPTASRQPDFLTSDDPAFRPVQVKLGPDGALWVADFYNPIIGHYEVPLTHPARDHGHGRLWRIVWRGLDGQAPVPTLPDLAALPTRVLAGRLADENLVVRGLALHELVGRADAATAIPALRAAAAELVAGRDPRADATAALPLFWALEHLGATDAAQVRAAWQRPGSPVALAALAVATARPALIDAARTELTDLAALPGNELFWRRAAGVFAAAPQPWKAALLLTVLRRTASADVELAYALRSALKTHLASATAEEFATLVATAGAEGAKEADRLVAEVALAVKTPASAEFLLGHLERTKSAGPRAAELARHAVQQLPVAELTRVRPLMLALSGAPLAQRVTLAEGLAGVAAKAGAVLPADVTPWMEAELLAGVTDKDPAVALSAINALKPLTVPGKAEALRRVALSPTIRESNRIAAIKALAPAAPDTEAILIEVLTTAAASAQTLRRTAADLLGGPAAGARAREALVATFTGASADLALSLATALARTDEGAGQLVEAATAGRVRPALLRHRYVQAALAKRPADLRERVQALTAGLPPEDARIDAVIAARLEAAKVTKGDAARGAPLFTAHCAACHRYRDEGGNLGPSLDGIGARSLARIVEDILDPNRNVDPLFRVSSVTLKSGETKSGLDLRDDGARWRLRDVANGQDIVIEKTDVVSTTRTDTSPMPAAFETALGTQEFFDLLDYLRNPGK